MLSWYRDAPQQIGKISKKAWQTLQKWVRTFRDYISKSHDPLPPPFLEATLEIAKRLSQLSNSPTTPVREE